MFVTFPRLSFEGSTSMLSSVTQARLKLSGSTLQKWLETVDSSSTYLEGLGGPAEPV